MNGLDAGGAKPTVAGPKLNVLLAELQDQSERHSGLVSDVGAALTRLRNVADVSATDGPEKGGSDKPGGLPGVLADYTNTNDRLAVILAELTKLI